jgi:hypothetical protein
MRRSRVAWFSGIAQQQTPPAACEHKGRAQNQLDRPDNDDVEHAPAELQASWPLSLAVGQGGDERFGF